MKRENQLGRLFRALTSDTQKEFAARTGLHVSTISHCENGGPGPGPGTLEIMAAAACITAAGGDELLKHYDVLRTPRVRPGRGADRLLTELGEEVRAIAERTYQRLLRLPAPAKLPQPEDRQLAEEQIADLRNLHELVRSEAVKTIREYQTLALAERVAEEAVETASSDPAKAAGWARLALEIADCLGAPAMDQAEEVNASLQKLKARIGPVLQRPVPKRP